VDEQTINAIVAEISTVLAGRLPGKLFQLTPLSLAIDFRLRDPRYLLISVEPSQPRLHLIQRRLRDLEKTSLSLSPFALWLRKELSGLRLDSIDKDSGDRIVRFSFTGRDDLGAMQSRTLVAQLTGRTSNLLLLDQNQVILGSIRATRGPGQSPGDKYHPPAATRSHGAGVSSSTPGSPAGQPGWGGAVREGSARDTSLSATLDVHYHALAVEQAFNSMASSARAQIHKRLARTEKLLQKLLDDLASHADADQQKHIGDLLLANLSTAKRQGQRVKLIDYFDERAPVIEIEVDENLTLPQEATRRFAAYSRSKRAAEKIRGRIAGVKAELDELRTRQIRLDKIIAERDEAALAEFAGAPSVPPAAGGSPPVPPALAGGLKRKPEKKIPGTRRYLSSDGYEILVGRAARDNDHLTFKVARPNDLWLHAADYPGSHVVIRNSTRKEIPHRTIIEAAQLAAYFSDARKDAKVTVRYTPRKFLSKPKGAAPGLVRLSRFKSINVEPRETPERIL
jgi:predicted ribosome quality control (RQC) complex YloA/Tae2 family protein